MISCAVTVQLTCTFVFAYAESMFSQDAAHNNHCFVQITKIAAKPKDVKLISINSNIDVKKILTQTSDDFKML